ncbi:restriction endonuclease subunit S [Adlercreutzia muris]|uniref:Restriction endonuclease subunit S n=3 Tax=Adlercreutzia TaxID=447020 RepID=A0A7C8BRK3_9ACTN|nr:restriction endonuclease subunit S [Adlercreutzia muris]KAB1650849.1 restriction endonuclease subunit S [Adlercreutzia muris]MCR2028078.1 restriction endonuclease subunit S [Adlercreutzia muris]
MADQRKCENDSVPALRFEGFSDPWEQRKLGELYEKAGRKNSGEYGGESIISVANMRFSPADRELAEGYLETYNVMDLGDIAFEGNRSKHFAHGRFVENDIGPGIVSHVFDVFRPKTQYDLAYWKYAINNERVMGAILVRSTKASTMMHNLVAADFLKESMPAPTVPEQSRIGLFFQKLDSLITLHQRKVDKLKTVKQSLLEKMFPREGENVPEIRFEGFTDPWEQRAFDEFIHASGLRNADNLDFESYSVSNTSGFVPQSEQFENGGTMAEADKTAYWIVEPGSFAYNPARINVGSIGYLSTRENVIISSLYEVFRSDETCDDRFLWHWFKTALFAKQIEALQEGGVRLYFFFDKLLKSRIAMPSTGEQHAIGSFFDLLDSLITLHQRELEILKNLKQACLEKMFV